MSTPGKKAPTKAAATGKASRGTFRRVIAVGMTLIAAAGLIWGVSRLGDLARNAVSNRDRYRVQFAAIDCGPPAGLDRRTFLAEVRYCSAFPEQFQLLDPDLTRKLSAAFASHPWVATVERVSVEPGGSVRVALAYRTPALAVRTADGLRVVDASGVLLPLAADPRGLPELATPVPSPGVSAGQVWADDVVQRAVQLVELYRPRTLAKAGAAWRLTLADGKAVMLER